MFLILIQKKKKIFKNLCNSSFPPFICPDYSLVCSPTDKSNFFSSYFSANFSLSNSNDPDPPILPFINSMRSIIISDHKVYQVLFSLMTKKASGPDGIPPSFLKDFAEELAPLLYHLFASILNTNIYLSSWKHTLAQLVPKKGYHSNPYNYRPVACTSAITKVFKALLNSHFTTHLESNNLLSDHQ